MGGRQAGRAGHRRLTGLLIYSKFARFACVVTLNSLSFVLICISEMPLRINRYAKNRSL